MSLYQMATFGGMALGSWLWGSVAEGYGPAEALLASAALMLVGAAIGLFLPAAGPCRRSTSTRSTAGASRTWRSICKPRCGPIVIAIEYVIREEDLHDFLDAMAERRRIRRRDGARQWTLTRDLENPEIWVETYHTPTWHEYIRHNLRTTHSDAVVGDTLRRLHSGRGADQGASHDRASDGLGGLAGSAEADAGHPRLVVSRSGAAVDAERARR